MCIEKSGISSNLCKKSACANTVQAMPDLMPGFDKEIARMAQRLLINPRSIDWHTNVFATKVIPGAPGRKCKSYDHCWRPQGQEKAIIKAEAFVSFSKSSHAAMCTANSIAVHQAFFLTFAVEAASSAVHHM